MLKNEYQVFGLNSIKISIIYGILLIVFAVFVSAASGSRSLTSYIPAMLGLPILFLGLVAFAAPSKQKLVMHVNVGIGLIIFKWFECYWEFSFRHSFNFKLLG